VRRWIALVGLLAVACSDDAPRPAAAPTTTTATPGPVPWGWEALDAGPLPPREGAALVWTGEELVVWGGPREQSNDDGYRDGAAFDPDAGSWRAMSPSPLRGGRAAGVWTGEEALLWAVAPEVDRFGLPRPTYRWEGAAWDPASDTWRVLRRSPRVPTEEGTPDPVWTGELAVDVSIGHAYDPTADRWRPLPERPVAGTADATVWTGEAVVALVANRSDPRYPPGEAVAISYDPVRNRWDRLPPTGVGEIGADLAWDGERLVAADYEMQTASWDPDDGRWTRLSALPFRFYECTPNLARLGDSVLATHCSGDAVLTDGGQWAIAPPPTDPAAHLVTAGDQVLGWWSSDESFNFPEAPVTYFQSLAAPALGDDLALTATVPVGTVLLDLPDGTRLTSTGRSEEAGGLVTILTYELADPVCTLTSTYAGSVGLAEQRIRNDVSTVEAEVGFIDLPGDDFERTAQFVASVEADELDDRAHVLLEETTSDVLDIACADLATAEDLLDRIHR